MKMRLSTVPRPIVVNFCPVDCTSKMHKKEGKKRNVKSFNTDRFMNNDLNHNLVLRRNGNTIKTTFHGARQREAVHVDVRARIQSCACTLREEGRGGEGGKGFEWNAFRIMRHVTEFHEYVYVGGKCDEQVGSRVSSLEKEREIPPTFVPNEKWSLLPQVSR